MDYSQLCMGEGFEVIKFDCNEGVDYKSDVLFGATRPLDYTENVTIARLTIHIEVIQTNYYLSHTSMPQLSTSYQDPDCHHKSQRHTSCSYIKRSQ